MGSLSCFSFVVLMFFVVMLFEFLFSKVWKSGDIMKYIVYCELRFVNGCRLIIC